MPPERVFVVRSGPSLERKKLGPSDERLKKGRRYLVGYVGVMGRQEGIDLLLHAARIVVHGYGREDVHFALVGGGTSLEELRELAHELGIADYVTFTGRVPDAELLAVLNTADVCVNPDRACALNELSTMNKVMEYMALGKPIVQFDLKEGRASAGEAALYARPDDPADLAGKLVELLDDAPRRACMGRLGRARIEHELEWRHQAPRLLAAYAALAPAPRARAAPREARP
jgi:glycosyltransferase involved in cell wall biosynthesis